MPYSGQLGTARSQPGNLELGLLAPAPSSPPTTGAFTVTDSGSGTDGFTFHDPSCSETTGSIAARAYRLGPEYWLPSWMDAHALRSGLLFNIVQHLAEQSVPLQGEMRRTALRGWLGQAEVGELRLEWGLTTPSSPGRDYTLAFTVPDGTASGSIRAAASAFDFDTTLDAVWYADPLTQQFRLRNLQMVQGLLKSGEPAYSICSESRLGLVPDSGIYYRRNPANQWEWLSPESPAVTGTYQFSLPASGVWLLGYGSQQRLNALASGTVILSWVGGQSIALPLVLQTPANVFDSYGALLGIPRFKVGLTYEDNLAYKQRLLEQAEAPGDPTLGGVVRGIASRIGTLNKLSWDGVSLLTFDSTGASGVTFAYLPRVPQLREITEPLAPSGDLLTALYTATYPNWRSGWLVTVDGVPENNVAVAGNTVILSRLVSGSVQATYSVQQYTLNGTASGSIGSISPGTGLASGAYSLFLSRVVNAHVPDLPDYQRAFLLDAAGRPNSAFTSLAAQLAKDNPTAFARARWGMSAYWFDQQETHPATTTLPLPLDQGVPTS